MLFNFLQSNMGKLLINLFSRVWVIFAGILVVPIYLKFLGKEAYGLISFYTVLSGSLTLLDLGLSTALTRQVAIYYSKSSTQANLSSLIKSVEIIYLSIGIFAGLTVIFSSNFIIAYWLKIDTLSVSDVKWGVISMGILFAIQWPLSVYNGILNGVGKQQTQGMLNILGTFLRTICIIPFLYFGFNNLHFFFTWQVVMSLIFTIIARLTIRQFLLPSNGFSFKELHLIKKFASGMFSISLITFFLTQIDRLLLSKLVSLTELGFYNIAYMLGTSVNFIISTLQLLLLPALSSVIASGEKQKTLQVYTQFVKMVSVFGSVTGFFLIFFGKDLVIFWTKDPNIAASIYPTLIAITAGSMLNGIMVVPYNFMLAKGITRYTFIQNIIVALISVPLTYILILKFGILGAGLVWGIINFSYVIISLPIINKKYIGVSLIRQYLYDIGQYFLLGFCVYAVLRLFANQLFLTIPFWVLVILFIIGASTFYFSFSFIKDRVNSSIAGLYQQFKLIS